MYKLLSLILFLIFLSPGISYSGSPDLFSPDTDAAGSYFLASFFDLRDRESFIQVTHKGSTSQTVHVQVFTINDNCRENNFFDTFTPNDTHVYNMRNILTNNGNSSGIVLNDGDYGFVVVTAFDDTIQFIDEQFTLLGNFRIVDDQGYEYRTNSHMVSISEDSPAVFNSGLISKFNFNNEEGVILSDIIGFKVTEAEAGFDFEVSADPLDTYTAWDVDIYDENETPFSCRNVITACVDEDSPRLEELLEDSGEAAVASAEYGINNAITHSKGSPLLCPGNNIGKGVVTLTPLQSVFTGSQFEESVLVGLNNGNGRGSMDFAIKDSVLLENESFINGQARPVACRDLRDSLREFGNRVRSTGVNPETGDTMNYLVVGNDNAEEAIIFIPGTNSIIPDWPLHLFTNVDSSPRITQQFPRADNSLCSEYLLIFVDFPGVAGSTLGDTLSFSTVSKDIAEVVNDVNINFDIDIETFHLFGWSLGSLTALRFAEDNPDNINLGTLFLSGTKPGGGANGNQAGCATAAFDLVRTEQNALLQLNLLRLMFPYENQTAFDGLTDPCSTLNNMTFEPNVTLAPCQVKGDCDTTPCSQEEMCGRILELFTDNRDNKSFWSGGVPNGVYNDERDMVESYNECECFPGTESCTCPNIQPPLNTADGGVCACDLVAANDAVCGPPNMAETVGCSVLSSAEGMVVFNGREDLFIQWLFGQSLVDGYNDLQSGFATLINYDDDTGIQAGHALPLQAPAWMQDHIFEQLN